MRNRILFLVFLLVSISSVSTFGYAQWARTYGERGSDWARSIQQTRDGGFIAAGSTNSFGAEGWGDWWILKLDSTGAIEWQKTFVGSGADYAYFIQQTFDEGFVVIGDSGTSFGEGLGNFWVLKLDSAGDIEWQKVFGGNGWDRARFIQQTIDGGYIIAAVTNKTGNLGNDDAWILKLSSDGAIEWQRTYRGKNDDNTVSIQQTLDGGYIVAGSTSSFGAGEDDFWVLKLDFTGSIEWQKTYGGSGWDFAQSIQQTLDGGYVVAGATSSFIEAPQIGEKPTDFWVLKLDPSGFIEWQKTYGGYLRDFAQSIQQTVDEGYIFAGTVSMPYGVGEADLLIIKTLSTGDIDPSCGEFVKISDCSVYETEILPVDSKAKSKKTQITPQDTFIIPQDTSSLTELICIGDKPPKAPKKLKAKALSSSKIRLKWKDKSKNEDGFMIERRMGSKGTWEIIEKSKQNTNKYKDDGLYANEEYYYRVRAFNATGYSSYSNDAKTRTKR